MSHVLPLLFVLFLPWFTFGSDLKCSDVFESGRHISLSSEFIASDKLERLAGQLFKDYGWTLDVNVHVEFKNYQDFIFDYESSILFLAHHLFDDPNYKRLFDILENEIPQHMERHSIAQEWMQSKFGLSVDVNGFINPDVPSSRFAKTLKALKERHGILINLTDPDLAHGELGFARDDFYIALSLQYLEPDDESLLMGFLVHEATHNTTKKRLQSEALSFEQFLYYAGRSVQFHPLGITQKLQPFGYNQTYRADEYEAHRKQLLTMTQDQNSRRKDIKDLLIRTQRFQSQQSHWIKKVIMKNTPAMVMSTDHGTWITFYEKMWKRGMILTVPLGNVQLAREEAVDLARAVLAKRLETLQKF